MVLKAIEASTPWAISAFMMSSRVQKHSRSGMPCRTRSWALPSHTSVPWDRPDMRMSSSMVEGLVSLSMPRTKDVPNSGTPSVPVSATPSCSAVKPSASGEVNSDSIFENTSGSCSGTSCGAMPVMSCSFLSIVGSSWPSTSSFTSTSCIELKSKWVVMVEVVMSSAGCWIGVNW